MNPTSLPADASRRDFLRNLATAAGGLALAQTLCARDWSGADPVRYPDPDVVALDPRFERYAIGNAGLQRLYTGSRWAEGPAWSGVRRYLVWSDIPNDRQLRWLEEDGHVSDFHQPAGNSNGNTFDREGRLVSCEHGNRRVVRRENNGTVTVLADKFNGKPLNAPNDIVVHPDGGIWFTDPGYGIMGDYEGNRGTFEIKEAVYRIDPGTGAVAMVNDDLNKPNGLCFSPDYQRLYLVDTGSGPTRGIRVYDVVDQTKLAKGRPFVASMALNGKDGGSDGVRCDVDGNVWSSAGWGGEGFDGVHVFAPDGTRLGQIKLPEAASNVCFGGTKRNRLFITASQSLYALYVNTRGAHWC